jgi:ACS family tartrate transporter-like MFS transporter
VTTPDVNLNGSLAAEAVRKATRRLVPFMVLLFLINYVDRVNVGYAALTMNEDLGLSTAAYGLGVGLFFIGYVLFEVPSNLILYRVGARVWIARIMVSWGMIATATAFVDSAGAFHAARFLLGVAEAGFFPGMMFYLGYWFPRAQRARITALFLLGVPLALVVGAPLSTLILQHGNGWFGFAESWRAMFFIEGLPSIAVGVLVFFLLPSRPADARWLSDPERVALDALIESDNRRQVRDRWTVRRALTSRRVVTLAAAHFGLAFGLFAVVFFLPQIIEGLQEQFDVKFSLLQVGLVTAVPFTVGAIAMVLNALHSDRKGERRAHVAIPALLGAAGLAVALTLHSPIAVVAAISIGAAGIFSALAVFWQLPTTILTGAAAAGAIALINSFSSLSGFVGPYLTGWLKDLTGSFEAGLLVAAALMVMSAALILRLGRESEPGSDERPGATTGTVVPRSARVAANECH